jgi:hypothetical protein
MTKTFCQLCAPLSVIGQKSPVPVDFGKGIENKLDDLLKAIQGLSIEALKAAQLQGMLTGAIIAAIVLTFIVAITRK